MRQCFGNALISERDSVSRSTSPLQIKPLRVTDPQLADVDKIKQWGIMRAWQSH